MKQCIILDIAFRINKVCGRENLPCSRRIRQEFISLYVGYLPSGNPSLDSINSSRSSLRPPASALRRWPSLPFATCAPTTSVTSTAPRHGHPRLRLLREHLAVFVRTGKNGKSIRKGYFPGCQRSSQTNGRNRRLRHVPLLRCLGAQGDL